MLIQEGQFEAVDAAGRTQVVYVYRDVPFAAWAGPGDGPRGPDQMLDARGNTVRRVLDGEYLVVETGELLTATPGIPRPGVNAESHVRAAV